MLVEQNTPKDNIEQHDSDENEKNELDLFIEQYRLARELSSGFAASPEAMKILCDEKLYLVAKYAPRSLNLLKASAELNLESDEHRMALIQDMPDEIKFWPIDEDRPLLLAGAELGILPQVFDMISKRFIDGIENSKKKPKAGLLDSI